MHDPKYDLIPEPKARPERADGRFLQRLLLAVAATSLLVLAALYGPLLIQNQPLAAAPGEQTSSAVANGSEAQLFQVGATSLIDDQEALADLYDFVVPSVVNIQVTGGAGSAQLPFGLPDGESPLQRSQGTGFIYDNSGHIITNNHVVEDAEAVLVIFYNGFWSEAEVVATDPQADLAVLKVTPPEGFVWRPLPLAAADQLRVGHTVIAIGNPFGLESTMTTGVVSAVGRGLPVGDAGSNRYTLPDVIQTDAAINPGNSGGPLINLRGEVVGVNFAIESPVRGNSGVGFTIPVSIVRRVIPALIEQGRFEYAFLGLSGSTISPELAKNLDLPNTLLGVYVATVIAGGPSEAAGLLGASETIAADEGGEIQIGGDIIVAIDGEQVRSFEDLVGYLVTEAAPGQSVTLSVLRDDVEIQVSVELGRRPGLTASSRLRQSGEVNARQAIAIASEFVTDEDLLEGEITEKVATPETRGGEEVWVVDLSDDSKTVTVIVSKATGEVLDHSVE